MPAIIARDHQGDGLAPVVVIPGRLGQMIAAQCESQGKNQVERQSMRSRLGCSASVKTMGPYGRRGWNRRTIDDGTGKPLDLKVLVLSGSGGQSSMVRGVLMVIPAAACSLNGPDSPTNPKSDTIWFPCLLPEVAGEQGQAPIVAAGISSEGRESASFEDANTSYDLPRSYLNHTGLLPISATALSYAAKLDRSISEDRIRGRILGEITGPTKTTGDQRIPGCQG